MLPYSSSSPGSRSQVSVPMNVNGMNRRRLLSPSQCELAVACEQYVRARLACLCDERVWSKMFLRYGSGDSQDTDTKRLVLWYELQHGVV